MNNSKLTDTDILYIGVVPDTWNKSRIGSLYILRNVKVSDKDFKPLSVTMKGILPQIESVAKTNAHDDRKLVKKGDFVINSRSDRRGSCGIANQDGSVSLINLVLQPRDNMEPNFYNWFFKSKEFSAEFYRWGHGIVDDLWTTTWQDMKNIEIIVPPLSEQKAIADYLDDKCGQIDEIAKIIEEQIATLERYKCSIITEKVTKGLNSNAPMKDSGIEWIGAIPEHWKVLRNKYLFDLDKEIVGRNWIDTQLLSLTKNGVKKINDGEQTGKVPTSYATYQKVEINDIIMCLFDLDCSAVFSGISPFDGMISPAYKCFKCRKNVLPEYIDYYFRTVFVDRKYKRYSKNVRFSLSSDELLALRIIVPPLSEQKAIADYLDDKCGQIDEIIDGKRQQLETLKSYKQSLIYEYVTGKKEVPENE